MLPLAVLTGAFSIINGTISFGQFALKLKDVDSDTQTCILLLKRVNKDIAAAEELHRLGYYGKSWGSRQLKRTVDVIKDTRSAALELAKLIRVSKLKPLTLMNRFRWVLTDKESFTNREKRLNYCHHSLLQIIGTMEQMLPRVPSHQAETLSRSARSKLQKSTSTGVGQSYCQQPTHKEARLEASILNK
ncbi:hypothetical protein IFR05_000231 [Cadophora sp. M221]|nr:hypothetical protein IFR05_000231 [Cadophora sp. M221]